MEIEKKNNKKQLKRRQSIQLSSNLLRAFTQPNKTEKTSSKKLPPKRRKSIETIPPFALELNQNSQEKSKLKKKQSINNTSSVDKINYNPKNQRRQSYSELFMLKLNYVSNDIGLSQKPEGAYSNLYKDGKRVFDDLEKSNSLKNSFALSNSKTDLKEIKYKRRASLQPNFNFNFDFLNFEKNLKKKKKDNESDSSSSNDINNSSFHSSENQSEDIETKAKKKIELIEKEKEIRNSKKKNSYKDEKRKKLIGNGIILEDPNEDKAKNVINEDDDDDEEKGNLKTIIDNLKNIFNIRDLLKEQFDKINNLDEDMKKQILKRNNSFKNFNNKYQKDFILNKKDLERFFKRSKSLENYFKDYNKKYNMNNIEEIILKNLNGKNNRKLNLEGDLIEGRINQTNDETLNIKTNFNSPNDQNLKNGKFDNKTLRNENLSPSALKFNEELNSSEIKKKNVESFLTRGGKISFLEFDEIDKKAVNKFKKNQLEDIKTEIKKEEVDSNTVIDNLLNKIKEKNKEKITILNTFKEEQEKQLIELKQKKSELEEKKLQFNKEKKEKEIEKEKIRNSRMNRNKISNLKTHYKTISIELKVSAEDFKNNNLLNIGNNYENSLNLLSEPIITNKEKKFNMRKQFRKELLNSNVNLENNDINDELNNKMINNSNYDNFKNINMSNRSSLLNPKSIDEKESLRYSSITHQVEKGKNYLRLLKKDMNEFYKKKSERKKLNLIENSARKNIKDYIMPVNDLDDVIQINNIYMNLSPNFNINKKN